MVARSHRRRAGGSRFAGGLRTRSATVKPTTYDAATRTFTAVAATEGECRAVRLHRGQEVAVAEILPMSALVGLDQFIGAAILDTHRSGTWRDQIGVVEDAWVDGKSLLFRGRLSERRDVAPIARDMEAGIIGSFSVGFDIETDGLPVARKGGKAPLVRVKKWRPREVSIAAVPADQAARIRTRTTTKTRALRSKRMAEISVETEDAIFDAVCEIVEDILADEAVDLDLELVEEIADEVVTAVADEVAADEGGEGGEGEHSRRRSRRRRSARKAGRGAGKAERSSRSSRRGGRESGADAGKIRNLRAIAKRNGTDADFRDLEASGATLALLQQAALASIRTGAVEIDGQRKAGRGRGGLPTFDETTRGARRTTKK